MFDSQLVNATVLDAATLTCRTPAHVSAIIQLAVSGNSVDWVSNAAAVTFRYISLPVLSAVVPSYGLAQGGTLVTISGVNFLTTADVSYSCQFAGPSSAAVNARSSTRRRSAARLLPSVEPPSLPRLPFSSASTMAVESVSVRLLSPTPTRPTTPSLISAHALALPLAAPL